MNIDDLGAACKPARTSKQIFLGQSAEDIKLWASRWCKGHGKTSGKEGICAYVRALYKSRPEQIADPAGYANWYEALSDAQRAAMEVAHEVRLDRENAARAAEILAEEGRVVKRRARHPTPERKREQNRNRVAEFMAGKTDAERQEIGRKARANHPPGYEATRKREWRERERQKKLAAAAPVATQPTVAPATPASVPTVTPTPAPTISAWDAVARKNFIRFEREKQEMERAAQSAPMPTIAPARATIPAIVDLDASEVATLLAAMKAAFDLEEETDPTEEDAAWSQELNDILESC